ncbi:hypothetical protein VE25_05690 [Devosia geojensis]|uniref:Uncharacterized protein n=1 Tax=Devosia geojensis TaxID=443610 RepID=A0A0F5FV21_9HYPH|nr:hypothetical protein [Devosia geojensis]KKB12726.1 hypothetical protein VE25_05690 [Devosia geojensis]
MQSPKTHEQHRKIVEKRINTKNAPADFDTRRDLKRAEGRDDELQDAKPASGLGPDMSRGDRSIKRGTSQETEHTKKRAD